MINKRFFPLIKLVFLLLSHAGCVRDLLRK